MGLIRGPKRSIIRLAVLPAGKDAAHNRIVSLVGGNIDILDKWGDGVLLEKGTDAPNIRMTTLPEKQTEHLADFKGKVVVLEFWATWCPPCQGRMEVLQMYPTQHPDWRGKVVLIAVSVDDEPERAAQHLAKKMWNKSHNVWSRGNRLKPAMSTRCPQFMSSISAEESRRRILSMRFQ